MEYMTTSIFQRKGLEKSKDKGGKIENKKLKFLFFYLKYFFNNFFFNSYLQYNKIT
jgi:hypothetical protein